MLDFIFLNISHKTNFKNAIKNYKIID